MTREEREANGPSWCWISLINLLVKLLKAKRNQVKAAHYLLQQTLQKWPFQSGRFGKHKVFAKCIIQSLLNQSPLKSTVLQNKIDFSVFCIFTTVSWPNNILKTTLVSPDAPDICLLFPHFSKIKSGLGNIYKVVMRDYSNSPAVQSKTRYECSWRNLVVVFNQGFCILLKASS